MMKKNSRRLLAWTKANCKEGFDKNPDWIQKSREREKDKQWGSLLR